MSTLGRTMLSQPSSLGRAVLQGFHTLRWPDPAVSLEEHWAHHSEHVQDGHLSLGILFGVQHPRPSCPGLQGKGNEKVCVSTEIILEALCGVSIYEVLVLASTEKPCTTAVCPGGWSLQASSRFLQSLVAGWFILAAIQCIANV